MATLEELQKGLDERSINPNKLTRKQRRIIDELIDRGDLKGPKMGELAMQRDLVTNRLARDDEFRKDPIAASGKPGQATYELVGDLTEVLLLMFIIDNKFLARQNQEIFGKEAQDHYYKRHL